MAKSQTSGDDPRAHFPLQVRRVAEGEQLVVRLLSVVGPRIMGIHTHYHERRSYYCGNGCSGAIHGKPKQWKGYLAAERWWHETQLWYPCVLEVTEACELDMRGHAKRGQVWLLNRGLDVKGKRAAVRATLTEQLDPRRLPLEFPFNAVLQFMYHTPRLDVVVPCPLPDRVQVVPSEGDVPACMKPTDTEEQVTSGYVAEAIRKARERGDLPPINGDGTLSTRKVR